MNVLLTYFEPFAGRSENNSKNVAELLQASGQYYNIQFLLCELPVVYDLAAQKALSFIEKHSHRAHLILSLGECNGTIRLESQARNRDHTPELADNANEVRIDHKILDQEPNYLDIALPTQKMKSALNKQDQEHVVISEDAGSFVCNNTAFWLLSKKLDLPYGFIHVPHADKKDAPNSAECARIILEMLNFLKTELD